jgi:hypothetical protein
LASASLIALEARRYGVCSDFRPARHPSATYRLFHDKRQRTAVDKLADELSRLPEYSIFPVD